MKKMFPILFALFVFGLTGCNKDPFDSKNVRMYVTFSTSGVHMVAKVTVDGIDAKKIERCGLYWEVKKQYVSSLSGLSDKAIEVETEGGKLTYDFEIFPWSELVIHEHSPLESCVVVLMPYIVVDGTEYSKPTAYYETIANPMQTELVGSPVISGRDLIINYRFSFPEGNDDIEECGVYWHPFSTSDGNEQFVACGKEEGEYEVVLKEGVLFGYMYTHAYVKTRLGTYFSHPTGVSCKAGDMKVNIYNVYGITFERATVSATNTAQNEDIFPVLERGFCYIQHNKQGTTPLPTIKHNKITVEPGVGQFVGIINGLLPASAYYVRAYAINDKGVTYSSYTTIPTMSTEGFLPGLIIDSAEYNPVTEQLKLTGRVTRDNGYEVFERGFYYNTKGTTPTPYDMKVIAEGSGLGTYSVVIEGLQSGTYTFGGYGENLAGTGISYNYQMVTIP